MCRLWIPWSSTLYFSLMIILVIILTFLSPSPSSPWRASSSPYSCSPPPCSNVSLFPTTQCGLVQGWLWREFFWFCFLYNPFFFGLVFFCRRWMSGCPSVNPIPRPVQFYVRYLKEKFAGLLHWLLRNRCETWGLPYQLSKHFRKKNLAGFEIWESPTMKQSNLGTNGNVKKSYKQTSNWCKFMKKSKNRKR